MTVKIEKKHEFYLLKYSPITNVEANGKSSNVFFLGILKISSQKLKFDILPGS